MSARQHAAYDFTSLSLWLSMNGVISAAENSSKSLVFSPWSMLVSSWATDWTEKKEWNYTVL